MSRFGKLAVTTLAATLVLIAFGGVVRAHVGGGPQWAPARPRARGPALGAISRFGKRAVTPGAAPLVLPAFGGFARAMGPGRGCPGWPPCHGSLTPPSSLAWGALKLAWIEH